ncbi:MAG: serine hydrolase domain-containing protein [Bacteroidota bacterium]
MKKLTLIPLLLFITVLTFTACDEDDNPSTPTTSDITTPAELTTALTDIYKNADAPGFALSVIKNDQLLYQETFGKANIQNDQAYTNQTIQPIGSISKTFVAAAVVKAIEQGHFTLDTDINDILPVELKNPMQPNATIRVKDLVTHTSGLIDNYYAYFQAYHILPGEDMATPGAAIMRDDFGAGQREATPLDEFLASYYLEDGDLYSLDNFAATTPGSTWNYSNIATSLAAYLVEVATETPFKTYVATHILQPLGMNNTAYDLDQLDANQLAKLYWDADTPFPQYSNDSYPDAGIYTSNEDLSKYLLNMMQGVKGQSNTLFSNAGYALLFDPLLPDGITPASFAENQGIFWFLNGNIIKHDGSDPGTTCSLEFTKDGKAGYLLMTNMDASTSEHETAYFELAQQVDQVISQFLQAN